MSDLSQIPTDQLLKMLTEHPELAQGEPPQPAVNGPNTVAAPEGSGRRITATPPPGRPFDWSAVPQRLDNVVRGVARGATFGQQNRLAAGLEAATGLGGKFGDYSGNLAAENAKDQAIGADEGANGKRTQEFGTAVGLAINPANRVINSAVGRVIPATGSGLFGTAQRYANYGMQGGLFNTLYQATLGNQDRAKESAAATGGAAAVGMVAPPEGGGGFMDTVKAMPRNFAKGAAMGMGVPAAIEGGSKALELVLTPILAKLAPEEAAIGKIGQANARAGLTPEMFEAKLDKLGPAGMPANVGGQVTDYARDIAQFPGEARQKAQGAFSLQQGGKMSTDPASLRRVESAINHTLSDETAAATTDALVDLRTRTSSPLWRQMFREPRVPESDQLDILQENPDIMAGIRGGFRTARNNANAEGIRASEANWFVDGKPTFEAWHAGKEHLDDMLFSGGEDIVNPLTGQLTKLGRSIRNMRSTLLEEMQLHYPEYREALGTWSGPTQAMRMIELGQRMARGDARLAREMVQDMTENERDFFRIGLADQAKFLASKNAGGNIVNTIFKDPNQRRNIALAFRSKSDFDEFKKAMALEDKFATSKQAVLGGSPTAPRLLGAEDAAQDIGKATLEGAKNGGATGAAAAIASKGLKFLQGEPEAVRNAAAQYMFSTDPERKAELIRLLKANAAKGSIFGTQGASYLPQVGVLGAARFGSAAPNFLGGR